MSTELIAISRELPKLALKQPLGSKDEALAVLRILTDQPVRYSGEKKANSVLVGGRARIGVGTYGGSVLAVANDLPAFSLAWEKLRIDRAVADFYAVGSYPASEGVEFLHKVGGFTVRHYSITDGVVEHDEGVPLDFEKVAQSLTLEELESLFDMAPDAHRRVDSDGSRLLLDVNDALFDRVNTFVIEPATEKTWIPVEAETVGDRNDESVGTALADGAVRAWFGFQLLSAPERLRLHVFNI